MQLKGESVYSGSQFNSVVHRGEKSMWLDLEAAGHMTSATRKKTIVDYEPLNYSWLGPQLTLHAAPYSFA